MPKEKNIMLSRPLTPEQAPRNARALAFTYLVSVPDYIDETNICSAINLDLTVDREKQL